MEYTEKERIALALAMQYRGQVITESDVEKIYNERRKHEM